MKTATKLSAAALAGLMALSMTACGAASTHSAARDNADGTYVYEDGQIYRYNSTGDNKGNVRQDTTNQAGTDLKNAGQDLKDAAKDTARAAGNAGKNAANTVRRAADNLTGTARKNAEAKKGNSESNVNSTTQTTLKNTGVSLTTGLR